MTQHPVSESHEPPDIASFNLGVDYLQPIAEGPIRDTHFGVFNARLLVSDTPSYALREFRQANSMFNRTFKKRNIAILDWFHEWNRFLWRLLSLSLTILRVLAESVEKLSLVDGMYTRTASSPLALSSNMVNTNFRYRSSGTMALDMN
jgi:hypothetical protein